MTETLEEVEVEEGPETEPDEPETGDEPEQGDGDEEETDGPQEAPDEAEGAANDPEVWTKLEQSAATWRRRVSTLLAEDYNELVFCPLCPENLPGYLLPVPLDDETRAQVKQFLDPVELPEMRQEDGIEVCTVCNGYGEALTGSPIPGKNTKLCSCCNGNGWTDPAAREGWKVTHPPAIPQRVDPVAFTTSQPGSWSPPATDNWGRPFGFPNYGRDPGTMNPDERAADPYANN